MKNESYIKFLPIVSSTNSYVRENCTCLWQEAGDVKVVVVYAGEQTAGRGQRGNVWCSEKNENLLVSMMVAPRLLPVKRQFALSQVIALSVLSAMREFNIEVQLKWPNDIYVGDKKLAGILVELDCSVENVDMAVIGVGLNINQSLFPQMDKKPVSMAQITGHNYAVEDVLEKLLSSFLVYYSKLESGEYESISSEYKSHLIGYDKPMRYKDSLSEFEAVIIDVEQNGKLCLKKAAGGVFGYFFKEVELLL